VIVVYINQFQNLILKGVEQNKEFMQLLWNAPFTDTEKEFSALQGMRRQRDNTMTLEGFLGIIDEDAYTVLIIGSRHPTQLSYGAAAKDHRARIVVPYTDGNYREITKAYERAFGTRLEDEPVEKWILENYERRLTTQPHSHLARLHRRAQR
jgi:hypothetical protein